jgi:hypothetical protein
MLKCVQFKLLVVLAISFAMPITALAITLGQVDTFEANTTANWNGGITIQNLPGGPAGPSDHYILLIPGGPDESIPNLLYLRMSNFSQWTGNYMAAGVTGIEMDLLNPSTATMPMRVSVEDGVFGSYGSTTAFNLPPDGQWHHATFSLSANNMTAGQSAPPFANVDSNVTKLNIFDSASETFPALGFVGFGVDNVQAVPEPPPIYQMILAIIGVVLLQGNRRPHETPLHHPRLALDDCADCAGRQLLP